MVRLSALLARTKHLTGVVMTRPGDASHCSRALQRQFTRTMLRQHEGIEPGLENAKFALHKSVNYFRKLDANKKQRMVDLFTERLERFFAEDATFSRSKIVLSKVEVPTVFCQLKVYWKCYGDARDQTIAQLLADSSYKIRENLTGLIPNFEIPPLKFVPDRSHAYAEEMDRLFKMADYGDNYKANTSDEALLGSEAETANGEGMAKEKQVPQFIQKIQSGRRKARKEERLPQPQAEEDGMQFH